MELDVTCWGFPSRSGSTFYPSKLALLFHSDLVPVPPIFPSLMTAVSPIRLLRHWRRYPAGQRRLALGP